MKIVLDTNVVVSAFLNPHGKPAKIWRLILQGDIELVVDERIVDEYESVLTRPVFNLPGKELLNVLEVLRGISTFAPAYNGDVNLPHKGDEPFLEAALSGRADMLVTGNRKHFPSGKCKGIKVLSPEEFLKSFY